MSDEPATSLVYKEFEIHPAPYQLADTGEWKQWKVHIYILCHTEEKHTAGNLPPGVRVHLKRMRYSFATILAKRQSTARFQTAL